MESKGSLPRWKKRFDVDYIHARLSIVYFYTMRRLVETRKFIFLDTPYLISVYRKDQQI